MQPTRKHAEKFLKLLDSGLVSGLGSPEPGKMCIEAAWCRALGLPHGDNPNQFDPTDACIHPALRAAKIMLNDSSWSSNQARAEGLRAAGLAQMGSGGIDINKWVNYVVEQNIRRVVPIALRAAKLEEAALRCEKEGTVESAASAEYAAAAYAVKSAAASAAEYAAASAVKSATASTAKYATSAAKYATAAEYATSVAEYATSAVKSATSAVKSATSAVKSATAAVYATAAAKSAATAEYATAAAKSAAAAATSAAAAVYATAAATSAAEYAAASAVKSAAVAEYATSAVKSAAAAATSAAKHATAAAKHATSAAAKYATSATAESAESVANRPLVIAAQIFVEACVLCKTGGSEWLDLLEK